MHGTSVQGNKKNTEKEEQAGQDKEEGTGTEQVHRKTTKEKMKKNNTRGNTEEPRY